jgi:hypothetical protein
MKSTILVAAAVLLSIFIFPASSQPVSAGPTGITATIEIPPETRIVMGNETTTVVVEGYFAMLEKSGLETVGTISASLEISGGEWSNSLSQTFWANVERNNNYDFTVSVDIPGGVSAGQSESYNLVLTFYNQLDQQVGSTSKGTLVVVDSVIDNGGDDDGEDDDGTVPGEDKSISLIIPIFIVGLLIGLIVALIWAKKNLEIVRSSDGRRRIMLREKDSGHIIGKKDEPPIELD